MGGGGGAYAYRRCQCFQHGTRQAPMHRSSIPKSRLSPRTLPRRPLISGVLFHKPACKKWPFQDTTSRLLFSTSLFIRSRSALLTSTSRTRTYPHCQLFRPWKIDYRKLLQGMYCLSMRGYGGSFGCFGSGGRVMQDRPFEMPYEVGRSLYPADLRVAVEEMNG